MRLATDGISTPAEGLPLAILRELRPKQWLKNGLIFFGLVYALQLANLPLVLNALLAFASFCLVSSAAYVVNDLRDIDLDRKHPTKRWRPLASGALPVRLAAPLATFLLVAGLALAIPLGGMFIAIIVTYLLLTTAYSLWWKHVVLVDIFCVSSGFVLRAVAGAVAVDVPISPWLYVCTILGSLLIALGKRRAELLEAQVSGELHRPALEDYTVGFLDNLIVVAATASVMAYSLYTFSAENVPRNQSMMITIPVVLYGVFRYLFLVQVHRQGGSPDELLLRDRSLAASVVLFLVLSAGILYLSPR
ncbi:MAG: UbiA prenyltransferase [Chloroflexi bacterium]|nr:UbiA prenyltransferase [Chloroflexota bacterium]